MSNLDSSVYDDARKQLRAVRAWTNSALLDLKRGDRIDTLDALAVIVRHSRAVERALRKTLPRTAHTSQLHTNGACI